MARNETQGIAESVRVDEEGKDIVLRFTLRLTENERLPVEMRGRRVLGVLERGHSVLLEGRRIRDQDGVARPKSVRNMTTNSTVRVESDGLIRQALGFILSFALSIISGAAASLLVALLTGILPFALSGTEAAPPTVTSASVAISGTATPANAVGIQALPTAEPQSDAAPFLTPTPTRDDDFGAIISPLFNNPAILAIGAVVALVVFYLIYIRRR